ncbi:MAG: MBL fold metallo-hydrolase [Planctomycetota bacterium]|nr:MAG: MBL fold metallo-hydrolase [Planctomycetota bacterium]
MCALEIHEIPVTPFEQNCTLLVCPETGAAAVCDCGDAGPVLARAAELGVEIGRILATHGHLDHVAGTAELKAATGAEFWYPSGDAMWLQHLPDQARMYGWGPVEVPECEHDLAEGDRIEIGRAVLEVRHCPGHTPGHVVFYDAAGGRLVAGDVLFAGSVGRTDFPGGSWAELERSIRTRIYTLPDETVVHCGHGPATTVGREAATNPFVRR